MRRVRYASTNDIRYTGYGRRSSGSSGGGVSACECVPFRVAIERIVNR